MHNFPHQISNLGKFYGALETIRDLIAVGADVNDDETLGVALAKAGLYEFRGQAPLVENLKKEKHKPRANRGTEAAARDHRRFFLLCQLISKDDSPAGYSLTAAAQSLLAAPMGAARAAEWRAAMNGLQLGTGELTVAHPYRILVRLVHTVPGIEKRKLLLALEAKDDTSAEFDRILKLTQLEFGVLLHAVGATQTSAANGIKILPAIAEQLGDVYVDQGRCFPSPTPVTTEEGTVLATPPIPGVAAALIPVSAAAIAAIPSFGQLSPAPTDLASSIALRQARTIEHQKAVKSLAVLVEKHHFKLHQFPFDCLAIDATKRTLLIEVKTLDGSASDERQQAERAVGQLKAYRHFSVPTEYKKQKGLDLVAFTRKPSDKIIAFLESCHISTVWQEASGWRTVRGGKLVGLAPSALFKK